MSRVARWLTLIALALGIVAFNAQAADIDPDAPPPKTKKSTATKRRAAKVDRAAKDDEPTKETEESDDSTSTKSAKAAKKKKDLDEEKEDTDGFGAARKKKAPGRTARAEGGPEKAKLVRQVTAKFGRKEDATFVIQLRERGPGLPGSVPSIQIEDVTPTQGMGERSDFVVKESRQAAIDQVVEFLSEVAPTKGTGRSSRKSRTKATGGPATPPVQRDWQLVKTFPAGAEGVAQATAFAKRATENYREERRLAEEQQRKLYMPRRLFLIPNQSER